MLQRRISSSSFSLSRLSSSSSSTYCWRRVQSSSCSAHSVAALRFCAATPPPPPTTPPKLARSEILAQRWGCHDKNAAENKATETAKSSTSSQATPATTAATTSSSGGGFFSNALNSVLRHITRADEREEQEEMRKAREEYEASLAQRKKQSLQQPPTSIAEFHDRAGNNGDIDEIPEATVEFGGVTWAVFERLDVAVTFTTPIEWKINSRVAENFVGLQCVPQQQQQQKQQQPQSIHGLSISNFAYHTKVPIAKATSADLLKSFLAQFHRSVGRSSVVVGSCSRSVAELKKQQQQKNRNQTTKSEEAAAAGGTSEAAAQADDDDEQQQQEQTMGFSEESISMCRDLVKGCRDTDVSICELLFRPPALDDNKVTARALCKTFFHRSRRRHTVVVFAVPDEEWDAVKELVQHAVVNVTELVGGDSRNQM